MDNRDWVESKRTRLMRRTQEQAKTNDSAPPIVKYYNAWIDSQDNAPVTLNGPAQIAYTNINTSPQKSTESVTSILPKKEPSDAKQSQVQAKVKQEKRDLHDQVVDFKKGIKIKHLSSSDDDSDADSTISSATVLYAKTSKPFKTDPGAQTSNFTQYRVSNAYKQTPIPSTDIPTTNFTELKLSPVISPADNFSTNAVINNRNASKTQGISSQFQTP